jgi:hypothetical protein
MHRTSIAAALALAGTAGVAHADSPELIEAPTGWLLPGRAVYARSSVDTSGAYGYDFRYGLGDVAEFGSSSAALVEREAIDRPVTRASTSVGGLAGPADRVPYATLSFRMGVRRDRLFPGQPGVVLGFRKSFARESEGHTSRFAELHLVASKQLGRRVTVHAGVMLWDAEIASEDAPPVAMHDGDLRDQVRWFGGVELATGRETAAVVELTWEPAFCHGCARPIELTPTLSWGLRYDWIDWMPVQAGVRVHELDAAELTDVEIFGQLSFRSR